MITCMLTVFFPLRMITDSDYLDACLPVFNFSQLKVTKLQLYYSFIYKKFCYKRDGTSAKVVCQLFML